MVHDAQSQTFSKLKFWLSGNGNDGILRRIETVINGPVDKGPQHSGIVKHVKAAVLLPRYHICCKADHGAETACMVVLRICRYHYVCVNIVFHLHLRLGNSHVMDTKQAGLIIEEALNVLYNIGPYSMLISVESQRRVKLLLHEGLQPAIC